MDKEGEEVAGEQNETGDGAPAETGDILQDVELLDTSGWETYRNEEYGFEMRYPREAIIDEHRAMTSEQRVVDSIHVTQLYLDDDGLERKNIPISIDVVTRLDGTPDSEKCYFGDKETPHQLVSINGYQGITYNYPITNGYYSTLCVQKNEREIVVNIIDDNTNATYANVFFEHFVLY